MLITRRVEFSASHRCYHPGLTEEQNRAIYGPAANANGHGHNYILEVTLEGEPDAVTGMIVDLKDVKEILNVEIVEPWDHRFLNYEAKPFDTVIPTVENVAREAWRRLAPRFQKGPARLKNVRLFETEDLYVDYGGEGEA
jgi:6-pyruvoyltetrahydropterin/6-carboxytetrahydropterin synthase